MLDGSHILIVDLLVFTEIIFRVGLIREEAGVDVITPTVVDKRVEIWLSDMGRLDILKAITGVA